MVRADSASSPDPQRRTHSIVDADNVSRREGQDCKTENAPNPNGARDQRRRGTEIPVRKAQRESRQRQAAEDLQVTERHVRRTLVKLKEAGDRSVMRGLRGRLAEISSTMPARTKRAPKIAQSRPTMEKRID